MNQSSKRKAKPKFLRISDVGRLTLTNSSKRTKLKNQGINKIIALIVSLVEEKVRNASQFSHLVNEIRRCNNKTLSKGEIYFQESQFMHKCFQ